LEVIKSEKLLPFIKLGEVENSERFFRAISSYETYQYLKQSIERFLRSAGKQYKREYIKSILDDNLVLKYEDERFIILETKNHEAICKVGDDTSWCIVRSASQFAYYTRQGRTQYVLIDYTKDNFDKLYKIGFTLSLNNQITNAHDVMDGWVKDYLTDLLNSNGIQVEKLNEPEIIDIELLKKKSYKDAVSYLQKQPLIEKNQLKEVITVFSEKLTRSSTKFSNGMGIIKELMKNCLNISFITETEFEKYKDCFKSLSWGSVKEYFIDRAFVITKKPIKNIMSYPLEVHKIYHKFWKFNIEKRGESFEIIKSEPDKEWCEILLIYLAKLGDLTTEQKLLSFYCKMTLGEKIDKVSTKQLINEYVKKEFRNFIDHEMRLMNLFKIKYEITQSMLSRNWLIDWNLVEKTPVKLDITKYNNMLGTPNVPILNKHNIEYYYEMTAASFIDALKNYTLKGKKQIVFTKKAENRRETGSNWIEKLLEYVEKNKQGEIKFKDGVKFPLKIEHLVGEKYISFTIVKTEDS